LFVLMPDDVNYMYFVANWRDLFINIKMLCFFSIYVQHCQLS